MLKWAWIDRNRAVSIRRFAKGRLRACVAALFARPDG